MLETLYWFFELSVVADYNLYLSHLRDTHTFMETLHAYLSVRQGLTVRKNNKVFQP